MSDVSNSKINERSIVEHPNLRVIKIGKKIQKSKLIYIEGQFQIFPKFLKLFNFKN